MGEIHSVKIQKLKHTLELIKRHQNDSTIPLYSYQIIKGIEMCIIVQKINYSVIRL